MVKKKFLKQNDFLNYIFKSVFLIFIIFIIVSIFYNLFIYYKEEEHYSALVKKGQIERLNYISKTLEEEIGKVKVATYFAMKENAVLDLYVKFNYVNSHQKNKLLEAVEKRCMEISNTNPYVKDCYFYLNKYKIKISIDNYSNMNQNEILKIIDLAKQSKTLVKADNKIFIVDTLNIDYLGDKWSLDNIAGVFVAELDINKLKKELKYAKLTDKDMLFLTDKDQEEIYISTKTVDESVLKQINNKNIYYNHEKYKLLHSNIENSHYQLIYLEKQDMISMIYQRAVLNILGFSLIVLLTITVCIVLFYRYVVKPLKILLVDAFGQVKESNFSYRITIPGNEVFDDIYQNFNNMVERIEFLISKELKQEILVNQANLKHLQAQINPHFMYNSYFVLYRLIKINDRENSLRICENLGRFFQYITRDSKDEKNLSDEINLAQSYTIIQGYRFKNQIIIDFEELPERYNYIIVPRLIIQPVIENVFKYVVDEISNEEVILKVHYFEDVDDLIICIENSGHITKEELEKIQQRLLSPEENEDITALININYRLNIYYKQEKSVEVFQSSLGGLEVHIKVRM